jgi:hypothetical protein
LVENLIVAVNPYGPHPKLIETFPYLLELVEYGGKSLAKHTMLEI